ncbi:MAG TPA: CotH kinase family protein [Kofleriaceae bacterium]|nr:CotH kinase family protein [Kofleriaceae bacterium]
MRRLATAGLAAGLAAGLVAGAACGGQLDAPTVGPDEPAVGDSIDVPPDPSAAVFDPRRIHDVTLTMADADWATMRDNPWAKTWVRADFTWDGERVDGIGVRAFGSGSLIAGKPSLKLSFDHEVRGQTWRALDELKLDNSSQDPGYLDEYLCTSAMRRAGIPAARTGWARLTVNGAPAGFFVVLESIDDRFVERWFGHDDGALYSMNGHAWGQGLNPMADPLTWYEPETKFGGDGTELAAAADAVATGSLADVEAQVDLDGFLRESVARSIMGSQDSFSADGNNFYLFDDHGRVRIVPWDFDVDLGAWYWDSAMAVDPRHPWTTSPWSYNSQSHAPYTDPVLARALASGRDVDALERELLAALDWDRVDADAGAAAALIHDDVARDVLNRGPQAEQRALDLRLWLHQRWTTLAGGEVARCPAAATGVLRARDLAPAGTVGWGELLVDRTSWGPGFTVDGAHHCTGVFAHAPSTVTIQVPDGYGSLRGAVGLQDWRQRCGNGAQFTISQGGVERWTSPVLGTYDAAVPFGPIDLAPGPAVLSTTTNGDYTCDTASWLDLELSPTS